MDELNVGHDSFTQVRKFLDGIKHPSMKGQSFLSWIMIRQKQIYKLQLLKWRICGINQNLQHKRHTNRSQDERTIGNTNICNHCGRGREWVSRGRHNNRGGRYQHNAGKGHGRYAGTTGQGCGWEQNSDYIPQEVLNSLTPQQSWYMLQGPDALRQADTATSLLHPNVQTVGASNANIETAASMVSGISHRNSRVHG
mgnify:CR=1 FL=1